MTEDKTRLPYLKKTNRRKEFIHKRKMAGQTLEHYTKFELGVEIGPLRKTK